LKPYKETKPKDLRDNVLLGKVGQGFKLIAHLNLQPKSQITLWRGSQSQQQLYITVTTVYIY